MNVRGKRIRIFVIPALVAILGSVVIRTGTTQSDQELSQKRRTLRIGLSTEVVESHVNPNDVIGASQSWLRKIKDSSWEDTESVLFPNLGKTKDNLDKGEIDLIVLGTQEYLQNSEELAAQPFFTYMYAGEVDLEYILLIRKDSKIDTAKDLEGKRLGLLEKGRYSVASLWLDVYLMRNGPPGKGISLGEKRIVSKASQAILPVFFGQLDAALVVRSAFTVASTLNPQIGKTLKVLDCSPRLVPVVVCIRESIAQTRKSGLIDRALKLHETPGGLQTFTVFKMDRLIMWQKNFETNIKNLMAEHQKLKKEMQQSLVLQTEAVR